MLIYKAWRESRTRFLLSGAALALGCAIVVLFHQQLRAEPDVPMTYTTYIWSAVYKANSLRDLYIMLVLVLGLGGLLQERGRGTVGFSLALPVSRTRLVVVRAAMGLAELTVLALVPAVLIPVGSRMAGEVYPLAQPLQFGVLWTACGAVLFGIAFLLSTLLSGEYSAWVVSFVVVLVYSAIVHLVPLLDRAAALDLFDIMSGTEMPYFREAEAVWVGPLPWVPLAMIVAITAGLLVAAAHVTARQDFS
jgi:ABC-2 type transport system permease protein